MAVGQIAEAIGKGLLAGVAGTAAITATTMADMRIRGRSSSDAPAQALEKVARVQPESDEAHQRLASIAHWQYGTAWGVARGALDLIGVRGSVATVAHFGLVWGAAMVMLPALRIAPPPTQWGAKELVIDGANHFAYAVTAGRAYEALDGR
ncbi:MAG: hypothetical protein ACRDK3_03450 [Actinomycetota bacterium]